MPTREAMLTFLQQDERAFEGDDRWGYWIFESASGELVGNAGLRPMSHDFTDGLEIGYWVRSDRTKRGYATTAVQTFIDAAFATSDAADFIRISMDAANAASAAVPRKLGFAFLREERREPLAKGNTGSSMVFELERPK